MTATDYVLIIGAVFTGICSVIAAVKANRSAIVSKQTAVKTGTNEAKLNQIHNLTNGSLDKIRTELVLEKAKNEHLQALVMALTDLAPSGTLELIQEKLLSRQANIGMRRAEDVNEIL